MVPLRTLTRLKHNTKLLLVKGPEAPTFLNGLISIKMMPTINKKNQHTITNNDEKSKASESMLKLDVPNWGIVHCNEWIQWDDPDADQKVGIRRDGRYGIMMKSNGRVLSDLFIYPSPFINGTDTEPAYLIEFLAPSKFKQIQMMLKLHKLKANVEFQAIDADVWQFEDLSDQRYELFDELVGKYFANDISKAGSTANVLANDFVTKAGLINPNLVKDNKLLGFAIDERNKFLGYRLLTKVCKSADPVGEELLTQSDVKSDSIENCVNRRLVNGVVEAGDLPPSKLDTTLPFEMNADWTGGINSDKGCYVGQELALRSWTKNAIPKRILPLNLDEALPNNDTEGWVIKKFEQQDDAEQAVALSPFGNSLKSVKPRRDKSVIGELIKVQGKNALGLIRREYFDYDVIANGDYASESDLLKPVWLCKDDIKIKATIQGQVWM